MTDSKAIPRNYVINRAGEKVGISLDRIGNRIEELCAPIGNEAALHNVDNLELMRETISRFRNGIKTSEIDNILTGICIAKSTLNNDYGILAARLVISNLHKATDFGILQMVNIMEKEGDICRLKKDYVDLVRKYHTIFDTMVNHNRDYVFTYFGFQTLIRSYLIRRAGEGTEIVERPQFMYLRLAIGTELSNQEIKYMTVANNDDAKVMEYMDRIKRNYNMISLQKISHASPTLFNSCTKREQLASCYQTTVDDDLPTILENMKNVGMISKFAGGISVCLTAMRAEGAIIKTTGGKSTGIGKYLRVFDAIQQCVNQGGLRPSSIAMYLEPWHADIVTFINAGRKTGRDVDLGETYNLKYALWIPDLFMEKVYSDGDWHLMCPASSPGLEKVYGKDFEILYNRYISEEKYVKRIKARWLAMEIIKTLAQSGTPYILFKDAVNKKCNLSKIRTIVSSNLCSEVVIPSWVDANDLKNSEFGVCVLGSIPLGNFFLDNGDLNPFKQIDFKGIMDSARKLAHNLDNIIDKNYYPLEACERSTMRHRPIGIGVAGLYDLFAKLKVCFGMKIALEIDEAIHAAIYYGAIEESCKIGHERGGFPSQHKNGHSGFTPQLQPDLWTQNGDYDKNWEVRVEKNTFGVISPKMWQDRRKDLEDGFLRNAYSLAIMPTSATSNIVGQTECVEPPTSNIYTRGTLSGSHIIVNRYLIDELTKLKIWNEEMRLDIIRNEGSIQDIAEIPDDIKFRYKTARELDQRLLVLHAATRGPFICQSQSLNCYYSDITFEKVWSVLHLAWKKGLKTGSYYSHSQAGYGSIGSSLGTKKKEQETTDNKIQAAKKEEPKEVLKASLTPAPKPKGKPAGGACSGTECTMCSG